MAELAVRLELALAEKEFRLALDLNPNYVAGQEQLAWFLAWSGRSDEALSALASMVRLDFASSTRTAVESGVYYHQRDYKTLVEASQKFITVNPDAWPGHYFLAIGYDGLGQESDAISEYQKAVELSHGDTDTVGWTGSRLLSPLENGLRPRRFCTIYCDNRKKVMFRLT